jgi:mannose-6-phosphate isomerase-like protein (cupin superfamily)
MKIHKLYTGDDGHSHFGKIEIDLCHIDGIENLSAKHQVDGVTFNQVAPKESYGWHNAPRRQYVITLAGEVDVEVNSGAIQRIAPGDVVLVDESSEGSGHNTTVVSEVAWVCAYIPCA